MTNGIVIPKHKIVYWFVPKNACTSLKKLFADVQGLSYQNVHDAPFKRIGLGKISRYANHDHIAVIRNPFDRLLSCYLDKIRPGYRGQGFPRGVAYNFLPLGFNENMTFSDFVNHIIDSDHKNPHWLPQTKIIPQVDKPFIRVFRFENLSERIPDFLNGKGITQALPHRNKSEREKSDYRFHYTIDIKRKVEKYYIDDLNKYKYKF